MARLGVSRNPKREFNSPFSFSLSVLFCVVRLTRPPPADGCYNIGKRAECTGDLKLGRDVTSGLAVLHCSAEALNRCLGWGLLILFLDLRALLLLWPDHVTAARC